MTRGRTASLCTRLVPTWSTRTTPESTSGRHEIDWQIATDSQLTDVERQGTTWALPQQADSVHMIVNGLRPGRGTGIGAGADGG